MELLSVPEKKSYSFKVTYYNGFLKNNFSNIGKSSVFLRFLSSGGK